MLIVRMSDLTNRLFAIVDLLRGQKQLTTQALAEHFGVSERTIRRDLTRLQDLEVEVETLPGRGGGVTFSNRKNKNSRKPCLTHLNLLEHLLGFLKDKADLDFSTWLIVHATHFSPLSMSSIHNHQSGSSIFDIISPSQLVRVVDKELTSCISMRILINIL